MAEPKLIAGAWWAEQPDGSWLRFDEAARQWVASPVAPPMETPTTVSPALAESNPQTAHDPFAPRSAPDTAPEAFAATQKRPGGFASAPLIVWFVLGAAVLVVIGSIGPWARVFGIITVNGTDGDGAFTLFLGVAAGAMALVRATGRGTWTLIVAAVCFGLCSLTGIVDWADIESVAGESSGLVEVAWGLVVMTLAALIGTVLSIIALRSKPKAVVA